MTALAVFTERIHQFRRSHLAPPPKLTVSEWADRHRVVSSYSAEPGPWRTERTPYLREIMDAFSDPTVMMVVFQKCARIGGTEAGLNIVGYFIDQDPSSILIVQPTVDDAKDFSKEQLAPMLADTPCLTSKVKDPRSRDSGNTVQSKVTPGGGLYLVGANSPRGFRRRTARVLDLEEIDGYPASAGTEGSPIKLALRRTATYAHRRKVYLNSTPTLKASPGFPGSPIEDYFLRGDQRRFHVPCPHCGEFQAFSWRNLRLSEPIPAYLCVFCGVLIGEETKLRMLERGRWVASNLGAPHRSYHINALYSPWISWSELRSEWEEAQGDLEKLKVFVNTALGETWEERSGAFDPTELGARRESYPAPVPLGVDLLTAGVDVQDDRLEAQIWGWGPGEEAWIVRHLRLLGDPEKPDVWNELDAVLFAEMTHEDGGTIRILATGIDSGAHTDHVYRYCRARAARRVYATKGSSEPYRPIVSLKASMVGKGETRCRLFMIGTDTAKDWIYGKLRTAIPGPGFVHLPVDFDDELIEQLTAEKVERVQRPNGKWIRRYALPRGKRAEALDCAVGALAALRLCPIRPVRPKPELEPALAGAPADPPAVPTAPEPQPSSSPPRFSRPARPGGWMKGFRR